MRMFKDRETGALELAEHLQFLKPEEPIVIGLANGGVPVAEALAKAMDAPYDLLLIAKLAAPNNPKLIVGSVDETGRINMLEQTARWHHFDSQQLIAPARTAFKELQKLQAKVRSILPAKEVRGRTVIVVSDGIVTGARMLGAISSLKDRGAKRVIVAAPAGCGDATWQLHSSADEVVIPHRPAKFRGIDHFYENFTPVTDSALIAIVNRWADDQPAESGVKTILMKLTSTLEKTLCVELDLPVGFSKQNGPYPAVLFAHGFESCSKSRRNVMISRRLAKRGIIGVRLNFTGHGTSEGDMDEATESQMLKDVDIVYRALAHIPEVDKTRIGVAGSGLGAMTALQFATNHHKLKALVLRGPVLGDYEIPAPGDVQTPTLLIHAEEDTALCSWIEDIDETLMVPHRLIRIENANRLFNDPISLEIMVNATVEWLVDHLNASDGTSRSSDRSSAAQASALTGTQSS